MKLPVALGQITMKRLLGCEFLSLLVVKVTFKFSISILPLWQALLAPCLRMTFGVRAIMIPVPVMPPVRTDGITDSQLPSSEAEEAVHEENIASCFLVPRDWMLVPDLTWSISPPC